MFQNYVVEIRKNANGEYEHDVFWEYDEDADEAMLKEISAAGLVRNLQIGMDSISFDFPDDMVKFWLRDIGAVLELQVYSACLDAGCFDDVVLSAVVNWEGGMTQRNAVTNEIDVMAIQGITPLFISCNTSASLQRKAARRRYGALSA